MSFFLPIFSLDRSTNRKKMKFSFTERREGALGDGTLPLSECVGLGHVKVNPSKLTCGNQAHEHGEDCPLHRGTPHPPSPAHYERCLLTFLGVVWFFSQPFPPHAHVCVCVRFRNVYPERAAGYTAALCPCVRGESTTRLQPHTGVPRFRGRWGMCEEQKRSRVLCFESGLG
jgi:hypothetical protein